MKKLILSLLFIVLAAGTGFCITVVNSLDGRDVISGAYYAAVKHDQLVFLIPGENEQLSFDKIGLNGEVFLIQSATHPQITGMENTLKNRGNKVETLISDDPLKTNIDLAKRSGAKRFIIVDPVYGYNTISVMAYAKQNSMYLIFADKDNAAAVSENLRTIGAEEVLLYGYTDKEVKEALDAKSLAYSEINNGDKFDDNMQITDMYFQKDQSKKQALLSDGNGVESTIAAGDDPIILISPVIPTAVYDYIKQKVSSGQIKVAMIVDQEYAQTAYNLKTNINNELGSKSLSVLVKFGQSTAASGDGMNPVSLFPLPGPNLALAIDSVQYNSVSKELEVTYSNSGNAMEYVRSNILVYADGTYVATVGDQEPFPLERGKKSGRSYPVDIQNGDVSANITSYFGASKKSYENGIMAFMNAGRVQFSDRSLLEITEFSKDKDTNDLFVTFKNSGSVTEYFRAGAKITLNGTDTTIKDDNIYKLAPSEARMVKFPGVAKSGSKIMASAEYGEREAFLDKTVEKEYAPASEAKGDSGMIVMIAGAILAILLIAALYLAYKKIKGAKGIGG